MLQAKYKFPKGTVFNGKIRLVSKVSIKVLHCSSSENFASHLVTPDFVYVKFLVYIASKIFA